ncbi:MAG: hypothetical protein HY876_10250, partial [Coriobacteriales bacterium]|nr:hypothetical protein [Coriobacteriales bacterium]
PRLTFPKTGTIRIETGIESSVQGGDLELEGPVAFGSTEGLTSPGADEATFEGIPLGGGQAAQATDLALKYGNAYLKAAPGLTVDKAEVVEGGVRVRGTAPDELVLGVAP